MKMTKRNYEQKKEKLYRDLVAYLDQKRALYQYPTTLRALLAIQAVELNLQETLYALLVLEDERIKSQIKN